MAHVKNLSNEVLTTITAGNIYLGEVKEVAEWELPLLLSTKIEIIKEIPTPKKKGKKK